MSTYVPRNDLSAFVEGLAEVSSPTDVLDRFQLEIQDTETSYSRDPRIRYEQLRYLNSLNRVAAFLRSGVVPNDLTPRERLAIRELGRRITRNVPELLLAAFSKVTLPAGMFGKTFEMRHGLAARI